MRQAKLLNSLVIKKRRPFRPPSDYVLIIIKVNVDGLLGNIGPGDVFVESLAT